MSYNYRQAIYEDITEHVQDGMAEDIIDCGVNTDNIFEMLYEKFWVCDGVTGNASGSYTFNSYKAQEYAQENMDIVKAAIQEGFMSESTLLDFDWEVIDLSIRCYLLSAVLSEWVRDHQFAISDMIYGIDELITEVEDNDELSDSEIETKLEVGREALIQEFYDNL